MEDDKIFECLDPRGIQEDITLFPPCERISSLEGKTVFFVDIVKKNSDVLLKTAIRLLSRQLPDTELIYYPKTRPYNAPESDEWWDKLKKEADAAVVAVGD
jgi:hypothetical protein